MDPQTVKTCEWPRYNKSTLDTTISSLTNYTTLQC